MGNSKAEPRRKGLVQEALILPASIERAPYEAALGKLTIWFSWLHFQLEVFGWKVWKLEVGDGMVLTKDLPTKHLVEKLRQTAEHAIPKADDRRDFQSILARVEKIAEKRNELLHSLWSFNSEYVTRFNRKRPTFRVVTSIDDIKNLNRDITETIEELFRFEEREPLKSPLGMALEEYIKGKKQKDGSSEL